MKRNYHMMMTPIVTASGRMWICDDCGFAAEDLDALRSTQCSHVYEPCTICGGDEESNECKPDCAGVLALISAAYVVGGAEES